MRDGENCNADAIDIGTGGRDREGQARVSGETGKRGNFKVPSKKRWRVRVYYWTPSPIHRNALSGIKL